MLHDVQRESDPFTSQFEFSLALDGSGLLRPEASPMKKCVEEASHPLGPNLRNTSFPPVNICSNDLGRGESNCSGLEFPPGFENCFWCFWAF